MMEVSYNLSLWIHTVTAGADRRQGLLGTRDFLLVQTVVMKFCYIYTGKCYH